MGQDTAALQGRRAYEGFRQLRSLTCRTIAAASHVRTHTGVLALALALVLSWLLAWALGGAHVAPHWFYLPILFAALRFGPVGALLTSIAAALLAGPLLPEHVSYQLDQGPGSWVTRGIFFVLIGQVMAFVLLGQVEPSQRESDDHRRRRELKAAIAHDQLELLYQPVVSLSDGEVVGAEALVRWQHPDRGLVRPADFLPDAERTGDVVGIDEWVLERAVAQAAAWNDRADRQPVSLAANLSGVSLAVPGLVSRVRRTLERQGLPPERLCLEVTETALLEHRNHAGRVLSALRELGVVVAIDDFGAGWSSYGQLAELPFDVIKIDRSLVAAICDDEKPRQIVQGLVDMARALEATTVAEGVETADQARLVAELGCSRAQGWYYARPSTPEFVAELVPRRTPAFVEAP